MKKDNLWHLLYILIIAVLTYLVYDAKKELRETNEVLNQCSERYYQEIGVLPK